MLSSILSSLAASISAAFQWITDLIDATGTYNLVIGVFSLVAMTRLLIVPIFGGALSRGSDRSKAKNTKSASKANNSNKGSD